MKFGGMIGYYPGIIWLDFGIDRVKGQCQGHEKVKIFFLSNCHATNTKMFIIQCPILWYAKVCALPSARSSYNLGWEADRGPDSVYQRYTKPSASPPQVLCLSVGRVFVYHVLFVCFPMQRSTCEQRRKHTEQRAKPPLRDLMLPLMSRGEANNAPLI